MTDIETLKEWTETALKMQHNSRFSLKADENEEYQQSVLYIRYQNENISEINLVVVPGYEVDGHDVGTLVSTCVIEVMQSVEDYDMIVGNTITAVDASFGQWTVYTQQGEDVCHILADRVAGVDTSDDSEWIQFINQLMGEITHSHSNYSFIAGPEQEPDTSKNDIRGIQ